MNVKYPINTTVSPSSEAALQELISKVRAESTGHYLLSEGGRWHGGIHITEKSHPNHAFEPIQALADGELVAYRITEDYLQSTYQDQILQYSNSFCLLRHQCPIPESENTFTFYSLYMHLRPLKCQPGLLYRVKSIRSIRSTANPTHADANRKTLSAGSLIECLVDVPAEQHTLNNSEYLFIKARTYNQDSGAGSEPFWIALHEKNRPSFHTDGFEAQNAHPRWYPQPTITPPQDDDLGRFRLSSGRNIRWVAPPYASTTADATLPTATELLQLDDSEITAPLGQGTKRYTFKRYRILTGEHKNREGWMAFDEHYFQPMTNSTLPLPEAEEQLEIRTNQLVILDTPISIRAGDPLGYLGRHERLSGEGDGSTEHSSHQIHLETFAAEPPPQELFNTEHWRWMKEGEITDHEGNPEENNTFFQDLLASLDENSDQHLSHEEVQRAYQDEGKATSLEHLISLHTSEWHDDANRTEYRWWEVYLGQVHAWARRHDERLAFYRRLQDNLAHEKERLTQLKWFDAAQGPLNLRKDVWHIHPIRLVSQMQRVRAAQQRYINVDSFIERYKEAHHDPEVMGWYEDGRYIRIASLNVASENSIRDFLNTINTVYYDFFEEFNVYYLAYVLATARLESYNFLARPSGIFFDPSPELITEEMAETNYGRGSRRGRVLGNTQLGDGYRFRGRGYCQLTGRDNYERLGNALNTDLINDPELASDPELATRIILLGMRDGLFTSRSLSDYLGPEVPEPSNTEPDYYNARRIINGVDKAEVIARYARAFQNILQEMD